MTNRLDRSELREKILVVFNDVYARQTDGGDQLKLTDDTVLLETDLDSLGFAIVVTQLDEELGYDPFSLSLEPFYPQTVGEFVDFYHKNAPT